MIIVLLIVYLIIWLIVLIIAIYNCCNTIHPSSLGSVHIYAIFCYLDCFVLLFPSAYHRHINKMSNMICTAEAMIKRSSIFFLLWYYLVSFSYCFSQIHIFVSHFSWFLFQILFWYLFWYFLLILILVISNIVLILVLVAPPQSLQRSGLVWSRWSGSGLDNSK